MSLFDKLVSQALKNQPGFAPLRMVVEKEIIHHDILRILSQKGLLHQLTFIGGTCLRSCYGGIRLSEDLDFTGGQNFSRNDLSEMGNMLIENLQEKFGFLVKVSEPVKDNSNVDTWKIKIETQGKKRHLSAQRINIDICAVSSFEKRPMLLLNPYGVDLGTNGLVIQAQSKEEIYTDKLLAFALRPNRIKHRDLWDITWLHQQNIKPNLKLLSLKINERNICKTKFFEVYQKRANSLMENTQLSIDFKNEMQRFLPNEEIKDVIKSGQYWEFIGFLLNDLAGEIKKNL